MPKNEVKIKITGDTTGLSRSVGTADREIAGLAGTTTKSSGAMKTAFLAGGAAVAAFGASSIKTFETAGKETLKLTRLTGGTAEEMSTLRFVARQSGVGFDTLTKSITILSKGTKAQTDAFADLGIVTTNADGSTRPFMSTLSDLAAKFEAMPNGAEKNALAMKLFGKSGADMVPLLNKGRDGIAELTAKAKEMGVVLDQSALDSVKKQVAAQRDLSASVEGLKMQVGQQLLPIMETGVKVLTTLTSAWAGLDAPVKNTITGAAGVAAGLGVVFALGGKVVAGLKEMKSAYSSLSSAGISAGPIIAFTGAVALQTKVNQEVDKSWREAAVGAGVFNKALRTGDVEAYSKAVKTAANNMAGIDLPTGNWERFQNSARGALGFLGGTGPAVTSVSQAFADNTKNLTVANAQLDEFRTSLEGLAPDVAATKIDQFGKALESAGYPAKLVDDIVKDLRDDYVTGAAAVDEYSSSTDEATATQEEIAAATQSQSDALKEYQDQLNGLFSPVQGYTSAQDKAREAQAKATAALKEYGATSPEYIQANRDAVAAAVDEQSALARLRQGFADGTVSVQSYTGVLYGMLAAGKITKAQYDEQIATINAYAGEVSSIPPVVNTLVQANTADAKAKLEELQRMVSSVRTGAGMVITGGFARGKGEISGRASGGPVNPRSIYEVVENGTPEVLDAGGRTYLLTGSHAGSVTALDAAIAGAGRQPTWSTAATAAAPVVHLEVVFQGPVTRDAAGYVAAALEEALKRGEPMERLKKLAGVR